MFQRSGRFGLSVKPFDILRCRDSPRQDHLEGDDPVQVPLSRTIDDPHPAARDLAEQLVLTKVPDEPARRFFGSTDIISPMSHTGFESPCPVCIFDRLAGVIQLGHISHRWIVMGWVRLRIFARLILGNFFGHEQGGANEGYEWIDGVLANDTLYVFYYQQTVERGSDP
jgi:hypothetical protein